MAGQLLWRGDRTWMVRIFLGRDPLTGKRKYHNKTVHGSRRDAQRFVGLPTRNARVTNKSFRISSQPPVSRLRSSDRKLALDYLYQFVESTR